MQPQRRGPVGMTKHAWVVDYVGLSIDIPWPQPVTIHAHRLEGTPRLRSETMGTHFSGWLPVGNYGCT